LEVNRQLESKGILVKNGAIVDATIISSGRRFKKIDDLATEDRKEEDTQEIISETKI
jgi:IS5 family transposase